MCMLWTTRGTSNPNKAKFRPFGGKRERHNKALQRAEGLSGKRPVVLRRFCCLSALICWRLHGHHPHLGRYHRRRTVNFLNDGKRSAPDLIIDSAEVFAQHSQAEKKKAPDKKYCGCHSKS